MSLCFLAKHFLTAGPYCIVPARVLAPPLIRLSPKGLFLAPTIVGESLKGALLLAEVFGGTFGLPTNPPPPPPTVDGAAADVNGDTREAVVGGGGGLVGAQLGGGGVGGRTDIVQALELGDRDRLIKFCEAVQLFSPVNAYVRPGKPWRFWVGLFFLFDAARQRLIARGIECWWWRFVRDMCSRRDDIYCIADSFSRRVVGFAACGTSVHPYQGLA